MKETIMTSSGCIALVRNEELNRLRDIEKAAEMMAERLRANRGIKLICEKQAMGLQTIDIGYLFCTVDAKALAEYEKAVKL